MANCSRHVLARGTPERGDPASEFLLLGFSFSAAWCNWYLVGTRWYLPNTPPAFGIIFLTSPQLEGTYSKLSNLEDLEGFGMSSRWPVAVWAPSLPSRRHVLASCWRGTRNLRWLGLPASGALLPQLFWGIVMWPGCSMVGTPSNMDEHNPRVREASTSPVVPTFTISFLVGFGFPY